MKKLIILILLLIISVSFGQTTYKVQEKTYKILILPKNVRFNDNKLETNNHYIFQNYWYNIPVITSIKPKTTKIPPPPYFYLYKK